MHSCIEVRTMHLASHVIGVSRNLRALGVKRSSGVHEPVGGGYRCNKVKYYIHLDGGEFINIPHKLYFEPYGSN